jgi:hypothetical protein
VQIVLGVQAGAAPLLYFLRQIPHGLLRYDATVAASE